MRKRTSRLLRNWLKDTGIGALLFLVLPLLAAAAANPARTLSFDEAFAGEVIASRAVEVTSPPGPAAENAIVAVAQLRPAATPLLTKRMHELIILGFTFSLLVGCNLAFWRHLRRINAAQRRIVGRTRS
ncbi:MAG: hypothetical protein AB7L90_03275 [Hyphomicrobiaceae bacterium]